MTETTKKRRVVRKNSSKCKKRSLKLPHAQPRTRRVFAYLSWLTVVPSEILMNFPTEKGRFSGFRIQIYWIYHGKCKN